MYTTLLNLTKRVPESHIVELTDDENTGEVNALVVDQAIKDACSQIDSKLRGRYPVPLSEPIADIVEMVSAIFTIHNLYSRKPRLTMSDGLARQYKKALSDLDELQKGDQILPGFEAASSHPSFILTNKTDADRYFSPGFFSQMP